MAIKALIGAVDVTEYLKQWDVTPGGDGMPGGARLYLDQEAGGLDLRPMMPVKIWQTHTGDAGIADKGRIFGGHVNNRDTGNVATTKLWALNCWDYSILLHKIVRDREAAKAVVLTAADFDDQISTLVQQIQRNGEANVHTDISTEVAMTTAMPAVTYPGGKKLGWYIQQLCDALHVIDPAVFPRFYMGTAQTSGIGDTFGNPVLWVYDGALLPTPLLSFSDTAGLGPFGTYRPIFGTFKRVTDATAISQRRQSRFGNDLVVTSENTVSQDLYPNHYINHGEDPGGNSGFWMNETFEDTESVSFDDAQARIDAIVAAESVPRDTFEFETPERVQPGDTIGLGWALEGIADDTEYTVAKVQTRLEPPDVLWSKLTVNARRLGLFDNNLAVYATPIEGDTTPPLAPSSLSATTTYDIETGQSRVNLTWVQSVSPDANRNVVYRRIHGSYFERIPLDDLYTSYSYLATPGASYGAYVTAVDRAGNESDRSNVVSGTAALAIGDKIRNDSYEELDPSDATLPRYHTRSTTAGGTAVISSTASHGIRSVKLATAGGGTDRAGMISDFFHVRSVTGKKSAVTWDAKASHASTTMHFTVYGFDAAFASLGAGVDVTKTVGTSYASFSTTIPATIGGSQVVYAKVEPFNSNTSARDVFVDNLRVVQQLLPDHLEDDIIDGDKINPTVTLTDQTISVTSTSKILAGGGKVTVDAGGIKLTADPTEGLNSVRLHDEAGTLLGYVSGAGLVSSSTGRILLKATATDSDAYVVGARDVIINALGASGAVRIQGEIIPISGAVTIDKNSGNILALTASAADMMKVTSAGVLIFGGDTNLYRSAANTLKTDDALIVMGAATFNNDMAVDASGGTSGTPRVLGLTNIGYARIQIGDAFTSMQANFGGRLVFQGYHGISFWGARATTGSVQGFEAGGGGGDPSVRIYGSQSGTKVAAVQGASGQSANLLDFENSSGTVLSGIASSGEFKFGANQVVGSRKTGWGAPTGTPTRTTFATGSVTLPQLAERVKALIDDLTTHGLIGA